MAKYVKAVLNGLPAAGNITKKITIAIEGNIASGKTELLKYFSGSPYVQTCAEPVADWRNLNGHGHNLLDLMYENPSRWGITFQTYVQLTMLKLHQTPQTAPIKMMERSIFSAKYCFVENLYRSKLMPEPDYLVLSEWFDWIMEKQYCPVNLIVYLKTTPEVVHERLRRRGRNEENKISLEYLRSLDHLHNNWLEQKQFAIPQSYIYVIDANVSSEEMTLEYLKLSDFLEENILTNDLQTSISH